MQRGPKKDRCGVWSTPLLRELPLVDLKSSIAKIKGMYAGWGDIILYMHNALGNVGGAHVEWYIVENVQCMQVRTRNKHIRWSLDSVAYKK